MTEYESRAEAWTHDHVGVVVEWQGETWTLVKPGAVVWIEDSGKRKRPMGAEMAMRLYLRQNSEERE